MLDLFYIRSRVARRAAWLGCSALTVAISGPALAQSAGNETTGVEDIIVTAQKREQSLQDVPIAVTALTSETLKVNRIESLMDLGAMAPNLNVRATLGGNLVPTYTMRGSVTYGSVAGQDKTISTYLDGVYLGSPYGSAFELPDLERIEVLRGPQGTLFGRNSTAGAISITTREPGNKFGVRQQFTVGNYDQFRSSTRVDFGQLGPFSASVSFTHSERRGEVKNLSAGMVWNYKNALPGSWVDKISNVSPKWLGDKDSNSVFAAVKFEPSDSFKLIYRFDYNRTRFTPEANELVAVDPAIASFVLTPFFYNFLATQFSGVPPVPAGQNGPFTARNGFTTESYVRSTGHNITASYIVSDQISVKNILAFRNNGTISPDSVGGYDAPITAAAAAAGFGFLGAPGDYLSFYGVVPETHSKQWSDEVQVNYTSKLLTITAGGIYYNTSGRVGAAPGLANGYFLGVSPGGVLSGGQLNYTDYKNSSYAGYIQAEVHVTPQLDIVGGYRLTHDKKDATTLLWRSSTQRQDTIVTPTYNNSKSSFMGGINYKPTQDILVYAKYSTGFLSGGSVSGIDYEPETVKSWEAGFKADLFDRRLRANVAVFDAKYQNVQAVTAGRTLPVPQPDLTTIIARQGDLHAKGFEVELTAVPTRGLTLSASTGYTDSKFSNLNPLLVAPNSFPTVRPKWTANLSGQFDTQPLFDTAYFSFRMDGAWRDKSRQLPNPASAYPAAWGPVIFSDAMWLLNGRIALRDIPIAGTKAELAIWGKNLNNARNAGQPVDFSFAVVSSYQPARTFGADLTVEF